MCVKGFTYILSIKMISSSNAIETSPAYLSSKQNFLPVQLRAIIYAYRYLAMSSSYPIIYSALPL